MYCVTVTQRKVSQLANPYQELHAALAGIDAELAQRLRKKLIWAYSWAIPNEQAISLLAENSPLVEVGAGTGYWAWLATQAGAQVFAYDKENRQSPQWIDVLQGDETAVSKHSSCALFLCWPPLDEPMAELALKSYRGSTVLYVGEFRGRTGSAGFHDLLEREFEREAEVALPCWTGFSDRMYLFRRRAG